MAEIANESSIDPGAPAPAPVTRWTSGPPRIHLFDWGGDGVPLLMLHGMGGNVHWWDLVAPRLRPAYRPVAMDFRGQGDSEWVTDGSYHTAGYLADIEAARQALGWDKLVLAGHSLGARLAMAYTADHLDHILGLTAVDFLAGADSSRSSKFERARRRPQPVYPHKEDILSRFRLEPKGTLLPPPAMRRLAECCVRPYGGGCTWKYDWKGLQNQFDPIWPLVPRLRLPLLMIRGGQSPILLPEDMERLKTESPDATTLTIPQALHHVPLDAPEETAAAMLSFLNEKVLTQPRRG